MIASCTRLVGQPVVDSQGADVGRVDRVLIDIATGRVVGVVIAAGGVFGLGERHHLIEWSEMKVDARGRRVVLDRPLEEIAAESPLSTL